MVALRKRIWVYHGKCDLCGNPAMDGDGPLVYVDGRYVCRRHVELARKIVTRPGPTDTPRRRPVSDFVVPDE